MTIYIQGQDRDVEYIRIFRDARNVAFHALVDGQWVYFHKFKDKRLPTYNKVEWPDPQHKYGWSKPYKV